jgi:malate dehydrogenase (oxaloacetate-decarboxylating)
MEAIMKDIYQQALELHQELQGKVKIELTSDILDKETLSLVYSPGVAEPCRVIATNKDKAYDYTWKGKTIAVISNGTAVLGLGDIGPEAALPVMEGKAALFKKFGDVDAIPICIEEKDPQEIIKICKALAPTFGGINLEDIKAPECVEIERVLSQELDIPVFHDDQDGTAIVTVAGLINALKLVNKKFEEITIVVSGAGAAGSAIIHMLNDIGVKNIYAFNSRGILNRNKLEGQNFLSKELSLITNKNQEDLTLVEALNGADVFLGVSVANLVTEEMVQAMAKNAILFAMANPDPEIPYNDAKAAGVRVMATGRSDYPNQINNVLAFPGLFKGVLASRAKKITKSMKLAAAYGLANLVSDSELNEEFIIPSVFDERVADAVAQAVIDEVSK